MRFVQSPAQEMHQHLEQPVDLILFHAVLEWVAEPQETLASLMKCLTPGGALSLMFYNYNGLLMRNVIIGNTAYVNQGMQNARHVRCHPTTRWIHKRCTAGLKTLG